MGFAIGTHVAVIPMGNPYPGCQNLTHNLWNNQLWSSKDALGMRNHPIFIDLNRTKTSPLRHRPAGFVSLPGKEIWRLEMVLWALHWEAGSSQLDLQRSCDAVQASGWLHMNQEQGKHSSSPSPPKQTTSIQTRMAKNRLEKSLKLKSP